MVASKRGRGARNQAPKAKPAEESAPAAAPEAETEAVEAAEPALEGGNGVEHAEGGEEGGAPEAAEAADGDAEADGQPDTENAESTETDPKKESEEEKVESGKILIENLPASFLFEYQEKLKELFSQHGEILSVKRGPIIVTELTTTPTLSAIVEFKNKDSLDKALSVDGTVVEGSALSVCVESRAETAVLVGVPYEASTDYVRLLFAQCGDIAHIHEFSKTKYKILRVTFQEKESVEKALKLDRELRINGFLVTVSKYRDDDEQKAHNANANKNKRQHSQQNRNTSASPSAPGAPGAPGGPGAPGPNHRNNSFRARGGQGGAFNARGNFRGDHFGAGGRGRGFPGGGRGGGAFRGGFSPVNTFMPPQGFMGRPGGFMDGQRPNKRLRQM